MAVLTFQYLRELQKRERDLPALQQIDESFYKALSECAKNSPDPETIAAIIKSIIDMRERKIVSAAIKSARADLKPNNLAAEEEHLFLDISRALKSYRQAIDRTLSGQEGPAIIAKTPEAEKSPEEKPPQTDAGSNAEKTPAEEGQNAGTVKLRAIKNVPAFVAEDLKTYGPLNAGDVAEIPQKAARVLLNSKSAEPLD